MYTSYSYGYNNSASIERVLDVSYAILLKNSEGCVIASDSYSTKQNPYELLNSSFQKLYLLPDKDLYYSLTGTNSIKLWSGEIIDVNQMIFNVCNSFDEKESIYSLFEKIENEIKKTRIKNFVINMLCTYKKYVYIVDFTDGKIVVTKYDASMDVTAKSGVKYEQPNYNLSEFNLNELEQLAIQQVQYIINEESKKDNPVVGGQIQIIKVPYKK